MEDIHFHATSPLVGRRWYSIKVAGLDKLVNITGDLSFYAQEDFLSWFVSAEDDYCVIATTNNREEFHCPKRSVLWFVDNGIYMEGDSK